MLCKIFEYVFNVFIILGCTGALKGFLTWAFNVPRHTSLIASVVVMSVIVVMSLANKDK